MCILLVALGCHPCFPIVCAHNRDEERSRPSGPECLEPGGLVCGRDLQAGGVVMGVNAECGYFAALTNCRSTHKREEASKTSRGLLVEHLLRYGPAAAPEFLATHELDGFHVVFGRLWGGEPCARYEWCCPEEDDDGRLRGWRTGGEDLSDGVFVVSNENRTAGGAWPKSCWLREEADAFLRALPKDPVPSAEEVHAGLEEIMGRCDVPALNAPTKLPRFYPEHQERLLHRGPFVPWYKEFSSFGTVSQRILVTEAAARCVSYFHRSTNLPPTQDARPSGPPRHGPWECIKLPVPAEADPSTAAPVSATSGADGGEPEPPAKRACQARL